ncbi:hypothetical protein F4782DRAFT_533752 [Xylaria castorea]|nr:hypothetical protein F4782DRAFT_533752 [Xylaria castorea]
MAYASMQTYPVSSNPVSEALSSKAQAADRTPVVTSKHLIKGLLQNNPPPSPYPRGRPIMCPTCRMAANRQGKTFNDPLRCHVPYNVPSSRNDKNGRYQVSRYIRGVNTGSRDEEYILVNRVYSMLRLENNPVLEYFEQKGGDLSGLPPNVRRRFKRVIKLRIRALQIGVAY